MKAEKSWIFATSPVMFLLYEIVRLCCVTQIAVQFDRCVVRRPEASTDTGQAACPGAGCRHLMREAGGGMIFRAPDGCDDTPCGRGDPASAILGARGPIARRRGQCESAPGSRLCMKSRTPYF